MKKYSRSDFRIWRKKGFDAERSLVKKLRELGFSCVRIPTSASSNEPLPDVYAVHRTEIPARLLALEVKAVTYLPSFTIAKNQIEKLFQFIEPFHRHPTLKPVAGVAVKFLRGPRIKGLWVVKFVEEPQDVHVDIADESDLEISKPTKRWQALIMKRRRGERLMSEPTKRSDPWYRKTAYARSNLRKLLRKKRFKPLQFSQELLHPLFPLVVEKPSKREVFVFLVKASKYPEPVKIDRADLADFFELTDRIKASPSVAGKTVKVGVAVKFVKGSRQKSPWVVRFVDEPEDLTICLTDKTDLTVRKFSKKTRSQTKKLKQNHHR